MHVFVFIDQSVKCVCKIACIFRVDRSFCVMAKKFPDIRNICDDFQICLINIFNTYKWKYYIYIQKNPQKLEKLKEM